MLKRKIFFKGWKTLFLLFLIKQGFFLDIPKIRKKIVKKCQSPLKFEMKKNKIFLSFYFSEEREREKKI